MYAGQIVEEGPATQVFDSPAHPYSGALAGAFPRIGDERFRYAPAGLPGDPPFPGEVPDGCAFHPRCPRAFDRCTSETPVLLQLTQPGADRRAACHLAEVQA
jgi:peptide/nickel transport system ATP-binding protein